MKKRTLGNSNLEVPALGLGCMGMRNKLLGQEAVRLPYIISGRLYRCRAYSLGDCSQQLDTCYQFMVFIPNALG